MSLVPPELQINEFLNECFNEHFNNIKLDGTSKNSNAAGTEFFDEFSDESNYNKDPDYYDG